MSYINSLHKDFHFIHWEESESATTFTYKLGLVSAAKSKANSLFYLPVVALAMI
jgi:hypothetical protein